MLLIGAPGWQNPVSFLAVHPLKPSMPMPSPYCYDYPRPMVTVDTVVLGEIEGRLHVALIRRKHDPFAGMWALPGGYLNLDEAPEAGARRELMEETGLEIEEEMRPLGFFGDPERDPRGRTISLVFVVVLAPGQRQIQGADDAAEAAWLPLDEVLSQSENLAFDHRAILQQARDRLNHEASR